SERVAPTRVAPACRAVLASASCTMRSRVAATSSWSGSTVPVVVYRAGTPVRSSHSVTVFSSACGRSSSARAAGDRLCTERRASPRAWGARGGARSRCPRQVVAGQAGGRQVVHGAAGLAQAVAGQGGGAVQVLARPPGVGRARDHLELGDDAGQPLGEGVVDLGGQPAPLVGDPGLPRL